MTEFICAPYGITRTPLGAVTAAGLAKFTRALSFPIASTADAAQVVAGLLQAVPARSAYRYKPPLDAGYAEHCEVFVPVVSIVGAGVMMGVSPVAGE
jgi:hypothetical protein